MKSKRTSGVLMHISTLPGDYSIGGFGKECKDFVDFLAEAGFSVWQVLPFCLPDSCHSPYSSYSSFSLNPWFISLPALKDEGLLTEEELEGARQIVDYTCEFKRLEEDRFDLLKKAASRVNDRSEIDAFLKAHPHIANFCTFMALKAANEGRAWNEWTNHTPSEEDTFAWAFTQYTFYRQWHEIKAYANERGISIIGDIPIYVAYDSADVWAHPELFDLDEHLRQRTAAGCPPDAFSEDGQFWGNPIYNWKRMQEDGFAFWKERLAHMFELFDGVRLDHFRGFSTYWSIPADAATAKEGHWEKGPGRAFVDAVHEAACGRLVIAEDLGQVTPDVAKLLKYSKLPGMRVLMFGFDGDPLSPHLPHNYVTNCVAYTGTHDNDTFLGYLWRISPEERRRVRVYTGSEHVSRDEVCRNAVKSLYASVADSVILPIQDLLVFGNDTRMNTPGTEDGNWAFRITKSQLKGLNPSYFYEMAEVFGRLPLNKPAEQDTGAIAE